MNDSKQFKWSEEQAAIHKWYAFGRKLRLNPNLVAEALAGTGKTTTIIHGINIAPDEKICYLVFNKKNQVEASEKITSPRVQVRTLHSLGFSLIASNWRGIKGNGAKDYFRAKEIVPDAPKQAIFQIGKLVGFLKNTTITPTKQDALQVIQTKGLECVAKYVSEGWTAEKLAEIALKVIEISREYPKDKQISFDDMVWLPVAMGWVKKQFDLVCVDECQDMNMPQLTMAVGSCNDGGRIVLVGDKHQAIYGFRGAMSNGIEKFKLKLNADALPLTINRRSGKSIIGQAQLAVPEIQASESAIDGTVETITEEKMFSLIKVKQVILARNNASLMKVCLALIRRNIPAYIEGRDVAKTLTNIVESLDAQNPIDFLDKLQKWEDDKVKSATGMTAATKIDLIQDQAATLRAIAENVLTVADIVTKINSLFLDGDYVKVPSVVCSTVHKAKGLEWPTVHILTETFKGRKSATPEELQEEKNIWYVAVTRAKETLRYVVAQ